MPLTVSESRYIELGIYRGLKFGVVLNPLSHPDLYLQGDAVRHSDICRDARGLAVLNALNRLARGYEEAEESTRQELALAESQLKDFQMRQGAAFPYESYLKELSTLRETLRVAFAVQALDRLLRCFTPKGLTRSDRLCRFHEHRNQRGHECF